MRGVPLVICCLVAVPMALALQIVPTQPVKKAADLLLDAKMQTDQIEELRNKVLELIPRVRAGGEIARGALIRLIAMTPESVVFPRAIVCGAAVCHEAERDYCEITHRRARNRRLV